MRRRLVMVVGYAKGAAGGGVEYPRAFAGLLAEAMTGAERFGHRQHVHLTWLAVRRYGTEAAVALVSAGIRRSARYAGTPQKYNATVSQAWAELVGHHAGQTGTADFDSFADQHPALVEPDLAPFPWRRC